MWLIILQKYYSEKNTCVLINLTIATKFKLIEHTIVTQRWKDSDKINIEQN